MVRAGEVSGTLDIVLERLADLTEKQQEIKDRIRAAAAFPGGRFLMDPGARVGHTVTVERTGWTYFRRRCIAEGRSKAAITARWGAGVTLASERTHTRRLLGAALRGAGRGYFFQIDIGKRGCFAKDLIEITLHGDPIPGIGPAKLRNRDGHLEQLPHDDLL